MTDDVEIPLQPGDDPTLARRVVTVRTWTDGDHVTQLIVYEERSAAEPAWRRTRAAISRLRRSDGGWTRLGTVVVPAEHATVLAQTLLQLSA